MNWNTNDEYIEKIGADSIQFLEVENMFQILGDKKYCTNCFKKDLDLEW